MSLEKYFTREVPENTTAYLEDSDKWFVKVRAMNNREKKERESLIFTESRSIPRTEEGLKRYKDQETENTEIKYTLGKVRMYEYETCIEDFCLPYVPKGATQPVDFRKREHEMKDVRKFLENMPTPLVAFVEDQIAKVNKEEKYAEEATEIKND